MKTNVLLAAGIGLGSALILGLWAREALQTGQIRFGARLGFLPAMTRRNNPVTFWALTLLLCLGPFVALAFTAKLLFTALQNAP